RTFRPVHVSARLRVTEPAELRSRARRGDRLGLVRRCCFRTAVPFRRPARLNACPAEMPRPTQSIQDWCRTPFPQRGDRISLLTMRTWPIHCLGSVLAFLLV